MWRGRAVGLGVNYKWKSLWLMCAVIFTVSVPVFEYLNAQRFAGALPPDAPIIEATGSFVRFIGHAGLKEVPYFLFNTDSGKAYRTENPVAPPILDELSRLKVPLKVSVEGFLLNDGRGSFFPLKITDAHGIELVPSDQLKNNLLIGRSPFYYKKTLFFVFIISVQWGFSIFYASQLRRLSVT